MHGIGTVIVVKLAVKRLNLLSGEPEIEQWTRDNWDDLDIDPSKSSEEIFQVINKRFEDDHRSDLSDILGDEKPKFLEFIEEDELVEITPKHIRLRKKLLTENARKTASRKR